MQVAARHQWPLRFGFTHLRDGDWELGIRCEVQLFIGLLCVEFVWFESPDAWGDA